jgi:hypothetical protein
MYYLLNLVIETLVLILFLGANFLILNLVSLVSQFLIMDVTNILFTWDLYNLLSIIDFHSAS